MNFDSGLKNTLGKLGASSLLEALELAKKNNQGEIDKRELLWMSYTEDIQTQHGLRPTTDIPSRLQPKLNFALRQLGKPILELSDKEFLRALEDWKAVWSEALEMETM